MKKYNIVVADLPWSFSDPLAMDSTPRGAEANYKTMTLEDLKNLPVKELADPDGAILALWVPSSMLQDGLDVMKAWGFNHKQTYVWVKTKKEPVGYIKESILSLIKDPIDVYDKKTYVKGLKLIADSCKELGDKLFNTLGFGMGRLFRNTHEIALIGTNNNGIYKFLQDKSQRTVSFAENLKHSAKPEHLQDSLEIMFPSTPTKTIEKIELFARRDRAGWVTLGNQSPSSYGEDIRDSIKKLLV